MATFTVLVFRNYFETRIQANWKATIQYKVEIRFTSKNLLVGVPVPVYRIY